MSGQLVTANDLLSGAVVFWTGDGWSPRSDEALVLTEPEAMAALQAAEADSGRAVGAYLAAVDERGLIRLREQIRITGPTIAYVRPTNGEGS